MSDQPKRGISCQGLDAAFEAEEIHKTNLILEAHYLLRVQQRFDEAASKMAQAAEIEERLTQICLAKGLKEKAWVHWFSAVNCWAQAGNLHSAITLGEEMLARSDLPERLRRHVEENVQKLRLRRVRSGAVLATSGVDE